MALPEFRFQTSALFAAMRLHSSSALLVFASVVATFTVVRVFDMMVITGQHGTVGGLTVAGRLWTETPSAVDLQAPVPQDDGTIAGLTPASSPSLGGLLPSDGGSQNDVPIVLQAAAQVDSAPPEMQSQQDAGQPSRAGNSLEKLLSSHRCHRMEPWGDVCLYENLCFDGDVYYYLNADAEAKLTSTRHWSCTCGDRRYVQCSRACSGTPRKCPYAFATCLPPACACRERHAPRVLVP
jgi:hypothetical protein